MLLSRALRATKGNVRRAAQLLGIGRATLYRKIQQYKLRLQ
jgi:transcriptional regulator of acetoin/glycerol metabolism